MKEKNYFIQKIICFFLGHKNKMTSGYLTPPEPVQTYFEGNTYRHCERCGAYKFNSKS